MKDALEKAGLKSPLMVQPVGYHTPDAGHSGFTSLPELPFGEFPTVHPGKTNLLYVLFESLLSLIVNCYCSPCDAVTRIWKLDVTASPLVAEVPSYNRVITRKHFQQPILVYLFVYLHQYLCRNILFSIYS